MTVRELARIGAGRDLASSCTPILKEKCRKLRKRRVRDTAGEMQFAFLHQTSGQLQGVRVLARALARAGLITCASPPPEHGLRLGGRILDDLEAYAPLSASRPSQMTSETSSLKSNQSLGTGHGTSEVISTSPSAKRVRSDEDTHKELRRKWRTLTEGVGDVACDVAGGAFSAKSVDARASAQTGDNVVPRAINTSAGATPLVNLRSGALPPGRASAFTGRGEPASAPAAAPAAKAKPAASKLKRSSYAPGF